MKEPDPEIIGQDGAIQNFMDDIRDAARLSYGFVLELGCGKGTGSTVAIQRGLHNQSDPAHISVDISDRMEWKPDLPWWHLVIGDTRERSTLHEVMHAVPLRHAGLIFIDTDHNYDQMAAELQLWSALANDNTTWLFHDTNMWGQGDPYRMVQAILEFAAANNWIYDDFRQAPHGLGRMRRHE